MPLSPALVLPLSSKLAQVKRIVLFLGHFILRIISYNNNNKNFEMDVFFIIKFLVE